MAQPQFNATLPPVESVKIEPTVRVMRLYKPTMHMVPTMPSIITASASASPSTNVEASSFSVSPFTIFPDNFGEIFVGERFAAYIAVVNGTPDALFQQVSASVRLQTSNTTFDLYDINPEANQTSGQAKLIKPLESMDMIVQHTLSELGSHTLRVSVQYTTNRSPEPKTIRKFYRFQVAQPLTILSNCTELGGKMMVQCQVTNSTKSPIFIEKMSFIPALKEAEIEYILAPNSFVRDQESLTTANGNTEMTTKSSDFDPLMHFNLDSLPLLMPNESYAFAVGTTKPPTRLVGNPEILWCSPMGEHGTMRGDDVSMATLAHSSSGSSLIDNRGVRIVCAECPSSAHVGVEFDVTLRIINCTNHPVSVKLQSRAPKPGPQTPHSLITPSTLLSLDDDEYATSSLCVTGLTSFDVGILGPGESSDASVSVCPLAGGLHELKGISALDTLTAKEYPMISTAKIFVYDDNYEE